MSNNHEENVKNHAKLKNTRLSLPSSASASSFGHKDTTRNPYSHLEYYQKIESLLSEHQTALTNNKTSHASNIGAFNQHQTLGSLNLFNFNSNNIQGFQSLTNQAVPTSTNFNSPNNAYVQKLNYLPSSINNNNNENLITFDTNDDLNVLDAFDPLKNSPYFTDHQKRNAAKSLESLKNLNDNEKICAKTVTAKLGHDHKIRSNSSIETRLVHKNDAISDQKFPPQSTQSKQLYSSQIEDFFQQIVQLKKSLDTSNNLSKLIVYSPILEFQLSKFKNLNINLNIRYTNGSDTSKRYQPLRILVSFNSNVETILYHVLNLYQIEELDVGKYFFKIHGLQEYLPLNACIAELKYFYDCINENREPVLILVDLQNENTRLEQSTHSNQIQHDFSLDNLNVHLILESKMVALVKKIVECKNSIFKCIEDESEAEKLSKISDHVRKLVENLSYLKSALFDIGHDLMEHDIFKLSFYKNKLVHLLNTSLLNEEEPLISSSIDYGYSIGNSPDFLKTALIKSIKCQIEKISNHVFLFIKCASQSFYSDLNVDLIGSELACGDQHKEQKSTVEIIQADSKLAIYFKGISRLDGLINKFYSNSNSPLGVYLKFSIVYGLKTLDTVHLRLDKIDRNSQKKVDFFVKTIKIQFDRMDLCILPRESCLLVELFVTNVPNSNYGNVFNLFNEKASDKIPVVSSSRSAFQNNDGDKCVAWASKSLFDEKLILEYGEYFLSMFDNMPNISSVCCTLVNIYSKKSPVVQIEFPSFENFYKYPSAINECECRLKDFQNLPYDLKEALIEICNQSIAANKMTQVQRDLINEYFTYLNGIPFSLSKVYLSLISYDYSSIIHFYAYLRQSDPLSMSESIELLLPSFPDQELRKYAIKSIELNSVETVSFYLPQLLEALKYEKSNYSELAFMLLRVANRSLKFAHKLYWHLREFSSRDKNFIYIRYHLLMEALKMFFDFSLTDEIEQETFLTRRIDQISSKIKELKDNNCLQDELDVFQKELISSRKSSMQNYRLPFNISYCVKELDIKSCSYINSFTVPIKLVFKNSDVSASSFYTIYKIGDDLRQDMFVIQMINVMNQLWLADDLDLNMITFECLQTGNRRGFIEMITNAETLKEIQKGAVMNAFKKNCINEWLRSHNPEMNNFKKAVNNFTRSCAGYSIATYLLGIGDRHNDNIMVKYTGHMFHIDFGKYLGDAQTFAGFKRDRTPILFTSDMFYVINQSKDPNFRFQEFIELCCLAFQILRKNHIHLLSIIELMIDSGIPGLSRNAIQYVYRNLMIDLDEDESSNLLKKIIHDSLGKFASINFAIHTLAQPKTVSSSNYFSFVAHIFNPEIDGKITEINIERSETTSFANSRELIKCNVIRETEFESNEVYRTFEEFCELYNVLSKTFTTLRLSETPSYSKFKEEKKFLKRYLLVEKLLKEIMSLPAEISQSEIIYTFFHPILRDKKQEAFYSTDSENVLALNNEQFFENNNLHELDIKGEVKLKLRLKDSKFFVNCLQCRNLKPPFNQSISSLKPYVKCYLRPDYTKSTKKKVQALFNGANPIFTETMEYDITLDELKKRTLELSVLNNRINFKEKIGSIEIKLADINWQNEYVCWYFLR